MANGSWNASTVRAHCLLVMTWLFCFFLLFSLFIIDSEPPEKILETGNGHGGGKKYFDSGQLLTSIWDARSWGGKKKKTSENNRNNLSKQHYTTFSSCIITIFAAILMGNVEIYTISSPQSVILTFNRWCVDTLWSLPLLISVENSGWEEGPFSLPLQWSDHLYHSQEEVWLIKTQLHEPVRNITQTQAYAHTVYTQTDVVWDQSHSRLTGHYYI